MGLCSHPLQKTYHMKTKFTISAILSLAITPAMALTPNASGVYEIANAQQLEEFAAIVNAGETTARAILTDDIDMDGIKHTPIGNSADKAFKGTWDGQFHTISCLNMEEATGSNLALFGFAGIGAKISNTIIDDLSSFFGEDKCAAFVGECIDSQEGFAEFTCLGTAAAVHAYSEDSNKGRASALVGPSDGNVAYRFTNCYNQGEVRGVKVGGMSCDAPKAVCSGCYTVTNVKKQATADAKAGNPGKVGTIVIAGVEDFVEKWGYNFFFGGSASNPTVFYPNVVDSNIKWTNYDEPAEANNHGVYKVFEETWASTGAMCWFLNNCSDENPVWGQNLDEMELYPTFVPGSLVVTKKAGSFEFENTDRTTTSAVSEIYVDSREESDEIYTIQGIRVENANVPGLYIIKGKKVLVK